LFYIWYTNTYTFVYYNGKLYCFISLSSDISAEIQTLWLKPEPNLGLGILILVNTSKLFFKRNSIKTLESQLFFGVGKSVGKQTLFSTDHFNDLTHSYILPFHKLHNFKMPKIRRWEIVLNPDSSKFIKERVVIRLTSYHPPSSFKFDVQ